MFLRQIKDEVKTKFLATSTPERARTFAIGVFLATIFWGLHLNWYMLDYTIPSGLLLYMIARSWRIPFLFYFGITAKTKDEMVKIRKTLSNYLTLAF